MNSIFVELDIFCVLLFSIIIFDMKKRESTHDQKLFSAFVINAIVYCWGDLTYYLHKGLPTTLGRVMVYTGNIVYFISMVIAMYIWLLYALEKVGLHSERRKKWRYIWAIPGIILTILVLLTPVVPLIFDVTENNEYIRGKFIWINWIICYGYVLVASIYVIYYIVLEKDKKKRQEYCSLLVFSVFPLISSILQLVLPNLSTIQAGFTLAAIFVYIRIQDSHTWEDNLTGLSNRKYFEKYLADKLKTMVSNKPLFLMMIDIDDFSHINDLVGHEAGDQALKQLAYIISDEAKARGRIQVARYDGDEFVVFGYDHEIQTAKEMAHNIQSKIDEYNITNGSYSLDISIGYIRATKDSFMNPDQLMDIADQEMRKERDRKRQEKR